MSRIRLTKIAAITSELDKIAEEVQGLDPVAALQIDLVSDKLEGRYVEADFRMWLNKMKNKIMQKFQIEENLIPKTKKEVADMAEKLLKDQSFSNLKEAAISPKLRNSIIGILMGLVSLGGLQSKPAQDALENMYNGSPQGISQAIELVQSVSGGPGAASHKEDYDMIMRIIKKDEVKMDAGTMKRNDVAGHFDGMLEGKNFSGQQQKEIVKEMQRVLDKELQKNPKAFKYTVTPTGVSNIM